MILAALIHTLLPNESCTTAFARIAGAFLTSLFVILCSAPFGIKKLIALKVGDRVRDEESHCALLGQLHKSKNNTPTMGGVIILFSVAISALLWMEITSYTTAILLATLVLFGAIGGRDDYLKLRKKNVKGMSSKKKFLLQTLFSCAIALWILYPTIAPAFQTTLFAKALIVSESTGRELSIPFLKTSMHFYTPFALLCLLPFFVFIIVAFSNAVNLTDGLDGLSSGTIFIASSCLACVAYFSHSFEFCFTHHLPYVKNGSEVAIFLSCIAAAALGFLYFNRHPAKVFMGDVGSIPLGALLGVSSILIQRELLFSIIGAIFVLEAGSVILQVASYKLRNKKRIFLCSPLHHHFEYKGWSEKKVVYRFWLCSLFFGGIGLLSLVTQ